MVVESHAEVKKQISAKVVAPKTAPVELITQIQSTPSAPMRENSINSYIGGNAKVETNIGAEVVILD